MSALLQESSSAIPGATLRPLSDVMGAEVMGLDLTKPFDATTRDAVYAAFVRYHLLVFRDQKLDKPQQIAFTEQFGTLEEHTARNRGDADYPLVHEVSNLGEDGKPTGVVNSTLWHTDKSFRPKPSMATILHAVTLPPDGGDTVFANMIAAYAALPDDKKRALADARVIHSWELSRENVDRPLTEQEKRESPSMNHRLVRTHPDSGRQCMFLGMHASHLDGLPLREGRARIEDLEAHATDPRFQYRHTWSPGDLLMWDNRCLLHHADPNFDAARHPRLMHRTCLRGATPDGSVPFDIPEGFADT